MRVQRIIFIILILIVVLTSLLPQLIHANSALNESWIDEEVEQGMRKYHIPGLALGVVKDGQVVFLKGYGTADDTGREVTPETPFILGSVSKPITSAAIMQLSEQGKLKLDEPVRTYLPWLQLDVPAGESEVTVRDLLRQTSGLSTYDGRVILASKGHTAEEIMRQAKLKLEVPPGERFRYSNVNYMLLGAIIEQVSGETYAGYIENHIFKPLDMTDSYAHLSTAREHGLASGYQSVFGKLMETEPSIAPALVPAGYLVASAKDMTHFMLSQMNGGQYGDVTVLSAASTGLMQRQESGTPYGMGWFTGPLFVSHGGDAEHFHSDVIMDLDNGWGIAVLMNTNDALLTTIYGNGYGDLSIRLLQAASNGALFSTYMMAEPVKFGAIGAYINAGMAALTLWLILSLYRLVRKRNAYRPFTPWFIARGILMTVAYMIAPALFLLRFPEQIGTPWGTILRFVPGWGHALLILPMLFIMIWLLEAGMLYRIRRRTDNRDGMMNGQR